MHADGMALAADSTMMLEPHLVRLQQRRRDRVFWLCLLLAFSIHALAILSMVNWPQNHRSVGSPDGAADAIAVEIVDGATLKDSMEPPTPVTPPPGQPPTQTAATQPIPPEPQPPPEPEPQVEAPPDPPPPQPEAEAPPQPPPPEAIEPPDEQKQAEAIAEALDALEQAPVAEQPKPEPPAAAAEPAKEEPPPVKKQEAPKKEAAKEPPKKEQKQAPKKRTQTSALDLSVPFDGSASNDGGSSSAVQRPPGITRSGENDEFARNVIRALQRSMPRERALGRVTVRIILNENGSRADVSLLKSGGDPDLDFNVMFAARQTAYPFPPKGATLADRTFMVTYIYR